MANAFALIDPQNSSLKRRDFLRAARLGGTVCLAFISVAFGGGIEVPQWTRFQGANPLYRHGAVVLSENRHYLIHQDGTPFFWLADTAWNGVLLAGDSDWRTYLNDRKEKGFTALQFVTTQWKAAASDQEGRVAFSGRKGISIHPDFFKRMDKRIDAINDHGMIAVPVLLWANPYLGAELNPGIALPEDQMIVLGQYLVARYGAHQVVWILNGDGDYLGEKARLWKNVGGGVFKSNHPRRLATLHPSGRRSVFSEFRDEKWFGFNGYYSGHTDDEKSLRWLLEGSPSREWRQDPGIAPPWPQAMQFPGSTQMKYLKDFFTSIQWWKLRPAQELWVDQPGREDASDFVVVAQSTPNDFLVTYLPKGGSVHLHIEELKLHSPVLRWFNPRTGDWFDGQFQGDASFTSPDNNDWAFWFGSRR